MKLCRQFYLSTKGQLNSDGRLGRFRQFVGSAKERSYLEQCFALFLIDYFFITWQWQFFLTLCNGNVLT